MLENATKENYWELFKALHQKSESEKWSLPQITLLNEISQQIDSSLIVDFVRQILSTHFLFNGLFEDANFKQK